MGQTCILVERIKNKRADIILECCFFLPHFSLYFGPCTLSFFFFLNPTTLLRDMHILLIISKNQFGFIYSFLICIQGMGFPFHCFCPLFNIDLTSCFLVSTFAFSIFLNSSPMACGALSYCTGGPTTCYPFSPLGSLSLLLSSDPSARQWGRYTLVSGEAVEQAAVLRVEGTFVPKYHSISLSQSLPWKFILWSF